MKNVVIVVVLLVLGAGAAAGFLALSKRGESKQPSTQAPSDSVVAAPVKGASELLHGNDANASALPACKKHNIPESLCAFCHPHLVEELGFCHGHGVPEAFCTRCSPILIAAFKVEGDWCGEHGLPESQCDQCKGAAIKSAG